MARARLDIELGLGLDIGLELARARLGAKARRGLGLQLGTLALARLGDNQSAKFSLSSMRSRTNYCIVTNPRAPTHQSHAFFFSMPYLRAHPLTATTLLLLY